MSRRISSMLRFPPTNAELTDRDRHWHRARSRIRQGASQGTSKPRCPLRERSPISAFARQAALELVRQDPVPKDDEDFWRRILEDAGVQCAPRIDSETINTPSRIQTDIEQNRGRQKNALYLLQILRHPRMALSQTWLFQTEMSRFL